MYVDVLIHVYVDSGYLSLKTAPTHVRNEHGNVVYKFVSLTRLTFPWGALEHHILLMKVKTHESQNAEEGYVFRLSAPETILQNIKVIHKLKLLSLEILLSLSERPSCQQHLVSTSRVVL